MKKMQSVYQCFAWLSYRSEGKQVTRVEVELFLSFRERKKHLLIRQTLETWFTILEKVLHIRYVCLWSFWQLRMEHEKDKSMKVGRSEQMSWKQAGGTHFSSKLFRTAATARRRPYEASEWDSDFHQLNMLHSSVLFFPFPSISGVM